MGQPKLRNAKGRFIKAPKPPPLDPALVKSLGSLVVPVREPTNILEALLPRINIDDTSI